jgi:hypothetical protein
VTSSGTKSGTCVPVSFLTPGQAAEVLNIAKKSDPHWCQTGILAATYKAI